MSTKRDGTNDVNLSTLAEKINILIQDIKENKKMTKTQAVAKIQAIINDAEIIRDVYVSTGRLT